MSEFIRRAWSSSARGAVSTSDSRVEIKSALFKFSAALSDVEWDCERAIA
jgi:hypothetical protein